MLKTFEERYSKFTDDYSNIFEIVTRASVIEREAKLDNERFIISGVISNRLEKDMLLQIDACVLYPLTDGLYNKTRVLYADLEVESLYNTYKYNLLKAILRKKYIHFCAVLPEKNTGRYFYEI